MDSGDEMYEKKYSSFLVNKCLAPHNDTILLVNEMNRFHNIDSKMKYDFLLNTITKGKRFSKWHKAEKQTESLKLVMEYYGYSPEKARQVMDILTTDQMSIIKERLNK